LPRRSWGAADDRGDFVEGHSEHVVQHKCDALGGSEAVEPGEVSGTGRSAATDAQPCAPAGKPDQWMQAFAWTWRFASRRQKTQTSASSL
jgi:hypothetical protein